MQSEPVIESRAARRGRRRKHGNGSTEGPVFVDTTGRRSRVLRRIGLLVGAVCLAYAGVLAAAFMGWGTSLNPSSLLPFGAAGDGRTPGGIRPQGGIGPGTGLPSADARHLSPSSSASASASASASSSASSLPFASPSPSSSASADAN
jgi:hypothetical protein